MNGQSEPGQKSKVWLWLILVVIVLIIGGGGYYCWQKKTAASQKDKTAGSKSGQYDWSTMNQGPYNDKISFATSPDLLNWTASNKILAEHASVPDVVLKDKTLYTYFVDVTTDGVPEKLGLIKSTDNGQTWSKKQIVKIDGVGEKVPVDPNAYLLPDGKIRLYFFDIEASRSGQAETNKIYSAVSSDGLNFKMEEGTRFEYANIFDPCVIKVGDTWRMYVGNNVSDTEIKIISATSPDGLKFEYEGVAAENATVPYVYTDGSKYYLFTAGIDIWSSIDGKTFTKLPESFKSEGKIAADPSVIKLPSDSYLMVYKTKDASTSPTQPPK